jgi:hypothetical protein
MEEIESRPGSYSGPTYQGTIVDLISKISYAIPISRTPTQDTGISR